MTDDKKRAAREAYEAAMRSASKERTLAKIAADVRFNEARQEAKRRYDAALKETR